MELQLGKQKRMMYARVFDRTEEETCSVDAVVPDALGDIGAIVVTEGTFCLWNLDFSDKSAQIEGSVAADVVYAEEGGALRSFPVELPVKTLEVQNLGDHHIYATHGSKILTHLDGLEYAELIDGVEHTSQFNSIFNGVNNVAADVTYNVIDLYGSVVASFTVPRGTVLETGKLAESGIHWMQDGQAVD